MTHDFIPTLNILWQYLVVNINYVACLLTFQHVEDFSHREMAII